ncbi:MAG: phage shock protein PspA [Gammaproteobacteria bacterium]|nr:MAG: phage shock protein PspA [Chloroflexota bacterium]TDJ23190.1 MAG: phage shock protein PspA [Gammaproteobacteria bacterium]
MSIFSRMSDIINANLNALLDKAEDPEKMVRLIVQEMEETLVEVRTTSARTIADKKELVRRRDWLSQESTEWERKAEVAIRKGREDLARGALIEKNKAAESVDAVDHEMVWLDETLAKLSEDTAALQAKIKDAKSRQHAIILRGKAAKSRLGVRRQLHETNIEDAMHRFEHYERKMDDLEGQVEAYDLGRRTLSDEIDELESDEGIDAELASLKARIGESEPDPQSESN